MSNRCLNCNKFVSLEMGEPEVDSVEIDESGQITGEVRLVLNCAECGSEMKETVISIELDDEEIITHAGENEDHTFAVDYDDPQAEDRYQNRDAIGKSIKPRYQKHFYGFSMDLTVTCSCGETFEVSATGEEQASYFDEL